MAGISIPSSGLERIHPKIKTVLSIHEQVGKLWGDWRLDSLSQTLHEFLNWIGAFGIAMQQRNRLYDALMKEEAILKKLEGEKAKWITSKVRTDKIMGVGEKLMNSQRVVEELSVEFHQVTKR